MKEKKTYTVGDCLNDMNRALTKFGKQYINYNSLDRPYVGDANVKAELIRAVAGLQGVRHLV